MFVIFIHLLYPPRVSSSTQLDVLVVPTGVYPVPNVTTEHRRLDLAAALVLLLIFTRVSELGDASQFSFPSP